MVLVNIDSLPRQVMQMLAKLEPPAGIELLSYKRNRTISISIVSEEQVTVREQGYGEQECTLPVAELPRVLKTMIKKEFPRSRKVRIHKFSDRGELSRQRKKL